MEATKAEVVADMNPKMIPKREMKVAEDVKIEMEERSLKMATGKICATGSRMHHLRNEKECDRNSANDLEIGPRKRGRAANL